MTDLIAPRPISRARFNVFAGYARSPAIEAFGTEVDWFEMGGTDLLAALILDTDREYSAVLLAADLAGKYRWIDQTDFYENRAGAQAALVDKAAAARDDLDTRRGQGDEGVPVDFSAPISSKSALHPTFVQLRDGTGWQAAHRVISLQMRWYDNQDGNFVEQFQTTAFDARIWELYLFAVFTDAGYHVHQPSPAPDFKLSGPRGRLQVEATTVNPTVIDGKPATTQRPSSAAEIDNYVANYLPIRYAGPLVAKLKKAYWDKPNWDDIPFVIAIQDFHDTMSMTFSGDGLPRYLYGIGGMRPDAKPERVLTHQWGPKEIESNFFNLPGAEHVAAVMFNPSGTLPKFNRIGTAISLGSPFVHLRHSGTEFDAGTQNWRAFEREVTVNYVENWIDGTVVYHNPNAIRPLDPEMLPGAAHYWWQDDDLQGVLPAGHLLRSNTAIITTPQKHNES